MEYLMSFTPCLFLLLSGVQAAYSGTVELALLSSFGNSDGIFYYANISVGTPGQLQTLLIDTGSTDTILHASNASYCKEHDCIGGTYNLSNSSTVEQIEFPRLDAQYADWSHEIGEYIRDTVQLSMLVRNSPGRPNNVEVTGVQLGLADYIYTQAPTAAGILGLGYGSYEAIQGRNEMTHLPVYPTFVDTLVEAGAISSRLFSIYLNTLDQYGSILFGGIDDTKYTGPLTTLNLLQYTVLDYPPKDFQGHISNYFLTLQEVTIQPYDGPVQTLLPNRSTRRTVPDTGTADWVLPTSAFNKFIEHAGVQPFEAFSDEQNPPELLPEDLVRPCSDVTYGMTNTTRFQLTLTGNGTNSVTLSLQLADLFAPISNADGSAATDFVGRPLCVLRVVEGDEDDDFHIISSGIMRVGYWVFDMDNGQISLAQAHLNTTSSNVVSVEAGPDGLSKVAPNHVAEVQRDKVEGMVQDSVRHTFSTATNTIGYAMGAESVATSRVSEKDSNDYECRSVKTRRKRKEQLRSRPSYRK
ncbi:acid protease [Aureobasidium subglaciale]|nr:acid protease [Aureobasidium subglaciale]